MPATLNDLRYQYYATALGIPLTTALQMSLNDLEYKAIVSGALDGGGTTGAPSGPAGGALQGTYPNPDLNPAVATSQLAQFTTATKGVVPPSGGGTTNFLRADGTFSPPPSGGGGAPTGPAGGSLAGTYPNPTIANNSIGSMNLVDGTVTNTDLAPVNNGTIKGRVSGGLNSPEDLTGTQATTLLDNFTPALKGLAPPSGGGTSNYLRADGSWSSPASGYTFVPAKTANYTANPGEYIPVDATSGPITITLPAAPANGTQVVVDVITNPTGNNVQVSRGGTDVIGNPAGTTQFRILPVVAQKWRATYNAGCWFEDVRNGFASAGNTPITPTATLTSTNVQTALQELDGDIQGLPTLASSDSTKIVIPAPSAGVITMDVSALAKLSDIPAGSWAPLYAKATSDVVITNNAAATADTELTVPVVANGVYFVDGVIFYDTIDAADFRLGFTAPTGSAMTWTARTAHSTVSGTGANIMNLNNVLLANTTACGSYATTYGSSVLTARPCGLLTVGTTAGNFLVRWGQFTANAANCARKADSFIFLRRVA